MSCNLPGKVRNVPRGSRKSILLRGRRVEWLDKHFGRNNFITQHRLWQSGDYGRKRKVREESKSLSVCISKKFRAPSGDSEFNNNSGKGLAPNLNSIRGADEEIREDDLMQRSDGKSLRIFRN
ncbi:hypothetical protein KM043_007857 [Ampulex compressa]|nr:hypothetical protein KM043_007857 [Ampulex compressa]